MGKMTFFFLFVFSLTAFRFKCDGQTSDSVRAKRFIAFNHAGKFTEARRMFAPYLQSKLPDGLLKQVWEQQLASQGKFRSVLETSVLKKDSLNIVGVLCDFEHAQIMLSFAFNPGHQVVGYHIAGVRSKKDTIPSSGRIHEQDTTVQVKGGHISGTLRLPDKQGKAPVALIIAGSGPVDRDGNAGLSDQSNDYLLLADSLAAHGIASFRYDKRYVGKSTDFKKQVSEVRFDDYMNDATALVHFLERDKQFSNVILIGHSEGSLIGILVAEKTGVDALISLAGAGERIDKIIQWQLAGQPGMDQRRIASMLDSLRHGHIIENVPLSLRNLFNPAIQPFLLSWMKYDPAKEIGKLKIPVLIINGTTDLQVTVAQAEMLHRGNPHGKLEVIPGMNHILKDAPPDRDRNFATYKDPALPLNAMLVKKISAFIKSIPSHNHS
jgi:alpha-beta hydrolase superfamily lysophospholipase